MFPPALDVGHRQAVPEKEAAIWYLGQDSFAVKTRSHLLIFDPLNPGKENSYVLPKSADPASRTEPAQVSSPRL